MRMEASEQTYLREKGTKQALTQNMFGRGRCGRKCRQAKLSTLKEKVKYSTVNPVVSMNGVMKPLGMSREVEL